MNSDMEFVIEAKNLRKIYRAGQIEVPAVSGVDLAVRKGEFLCVMGPSGCGKSSLLYLLGGLTRPTSGEIKIDGVEIARLSNRKLTKLRQKKIGFVFQTLNLLPTLSALENLEIALSITRSRSAFKPKELLNGVGLNGKMHRRPSQLSYGEQQRVAIARALLNNPAILLADEPTGNLDSENAQMILDLLRRLNRELNQTIVLITHDHDVAQATQRIIHMRDGKIIE